MKGVQSVGMAVSIKRTSVGVVSIDEEVADDVCTADLDNLTGCGVGLDEVGNVRLKPNACLTISTSYSL